MCCPNTVIRASTHLLHGGVIEGRDAAEADLSETVQSTHGTDEQSLILQQHPAQTECPQRVWQRQQTLGGPGGLQSTAVRQIETTQAATLLPNLTQTSIVSLPSVSHTVLYVIVYSSFVDVPLLYLVSPASLSTPSSLLSPTPSYLSPSLLPPSLPPFL